MESQFELVVDLVLAVVAALIGGMIAHRLRQPVILGYLLAGLAVGPWSPLPSVNPHNVEIMAEVGVALLMFALGVEFSLARLLTIGRQSVLVGVFQIGLTLMVGTLAGVALRLPVVAALFVAAIVALSSTAVVLRLLSDRGELDSVHGKLTLAVLLLQDLTVIPLVIVLPALTGPAEGLPTSLGIALLQATAVLLVTFIVGTRLVPRLLFQVAATQSRELFLLAVLALALGTAFATHLAGLSTAFGAFLAGIIVSESDFGHQILGEMLPIRDLFSTMFFVSIGLLVDPRFVIAHAGEVALLSIAIVAGKALIGTVVAIALGLAGRVALMTGLAIAQAGEFSFLIASLGLERGALDVSLENLAVAAALISLLVSAPLIQAGPALGRSLARLPGIGRFFRDPIPSEEATEGLAGHVVICGHGRVGRELATVLERRGFRYLVVEYNPHTHRRLQRNGVRCLYGDAGNPAVLAHASLAKARALVLAIPDPISAERAIRTARQINPLLDIIGRAASEQDLRVLLNAGATSVIQPEFEASLEFVRHVLRRYGVSPQEIATLIAARRSAAED